MKKVLKSRIFDFILIAIIFSGVGAASAYTILSTEIGYTPKDTTWKKSDGTNITNVKDAIDELYTRKQLSSVILYDKTSVIGNTTSTYVFENDINLGLVIISASNNTNDSSYYVAEIEALSNGNYSLIDDSAVSISGFDNLAGHRSKIYAIEEIRSGAIMQIHTRYAGQVQILKIS